LPRIPRRLRALGLTSLTAVVLVTMAPIDNVAAVEPGVAATNAASAASAAIPANAAAAITGHAGAAIPDAAPTMTVATGPTLTPAASLAVLSRTGEAIPATSTATSATSGAGDSTPATTAGAPSTVPAATVVVAFARSHLRARYRHAATGPSSFDCSGLMWRVFKEAGLGRKVTSRSARAIYGSYLRRGLASRRDPQVGDLIVWGRGSHVGVYIGHGYAISALITGVRVHRVRAMLTPFTAYLHTHLSGIVRPAWDLQLARHLRSLRHTTRSVFLRSDARGTSAVAGTLRAGTRFVVLARRRDARGRLWLEALTFSGRTGWLPLTASGR
jgi:cell wall-associated NlpC family hydrolase